MKRVTFSFQVYLLSFLKSLILSYSQGDILFQLIHCSQKKEKENTTYCPPSCVCYPPIINPALQGCRPPGFCACGSADFCFTPGLGDPPPSSSSCQPWRLLPTPPELLRKESGSSDPRADLDPSPAPRHPGARALSACFMLGTLIFLLRPQEREHILNTPPFVSASLWGDLEGLQSGMQGLFWYYLMGG